MSPHRGSAPAAARPHLQWGVPGISGPGTPPPAWWLLRPAPGPLPVPSWGRPPVSAAAPLPFPVPPLGTRTSRGHVVPEAQLTGGGCLTQGWGAQGCGGRLSPTVCASSHVPAWPGREVRRPGGKHRGEGWCGDPPRPHRGQCPECGPSAALDPPVRPLPGLGASCSPRCSCPASHRSPARSRRRRGRPGWVRPRGNLQGRWSGGVPASAGPARSLPGPGSPHWASSGQPLQSHTKLHTASRGGLQRLGPQAQPGDLAANRETARWPGVGRPHIPACLELFHGPQTAQTRASRDIGHTALGSRPGSHAGRGLGLCLGAWNPENCHLGGPCQGQAEND